MCIVQRVRRKTRIQPHQRLAQPPLQQDIAVVRSAALRAGLARGDVRAVQHRVAERFEPGEGGVFNDIGDVFIDCISVLRLRKERYQQVQFAQHLLPRSDLPQHSWQLCS